VAVFIEQHGNFHGAFVLIRLEPLVEDRLRCFCHANAVPIVEVAPGNFRHLDMRWLRDRGQLTDFIRMLLCEWRAVGTEENLGVFAVIVVGQLEKGVDKERPK